MILNDSSNQFDFWKENLIRQLLPEHLSLMTILQNVKIRRFKDYERVYFKNIALVSFYDESIKTEGNTLSFSIDYQIHNNLRFGTQVKQLQMELDVF